VIDIIFILLVSQADISGYVETRPYFFWGDSVFLTGYNRGWLELKADGSDYGIQAAVDLFVPYDTTDYSNIFEDLVIERLALWLGPENMRIIAGKQHLYWGVGRVFRPLDIFNETNFFEPGYEKPGYNALLGYVSLGNLSSLRGVVGPKNNFENSLYGLRIGSNIVKNDVGISVFHRPSAELTIFGGELAGEFVLGYWCEYSHVTEDTFDYSKFSIGVDYSLPLRIYIMTEFFFDGSGVSDPDDYDFTKIFSGERVTLAQHYLYSTLSTIPNPFAVLQPSINTLINLDDRSFIIIPQLGLSLFENTEIFAGVNYFIGSSETEFRNVVPYDGAVYVWMKVYF
jgi:hypothetical protein